MQLELSAFVEGDLDAIAAFIADDNPRRAVTFIRDIRAKFRVIQRTSLVYWLRPNIGQDAHLASVGHYAILFLVSEDAVRIERIVYGGRDLANLKDAPTRSGWMGNSFLSSTRRAFCSTAKLISMA
jgi:toxin ParE1/3/4